MSTLVCSFLDGSSSFLQVTRQTIKACIGLNLCQIPSTTTELAALEHLKNENNLVSTLALSVLIVSSLFLKVTRTAIRAWMGSKFGKIRPDLLS